MPDFPKIGGATAVEVWAHATRQLNADGANVIRDAILSDATKIAGGNIDTTLSSRAAPADILVDPVTDKIDGSQIDALLSSRAPSGEYDAALDAAISSRAPSSEYDTEMAHLDVDVGSRADAAEFTAARAAKMDKIQDFIEEATGTLTATGAVDVVKEIADTVNKLHCFIDLSLMQAADTIKVAQEIKIKAAGSYAKYAEEEYSGVQDKPMLYVVTKPARHGIKVTLEQTAGTYRDYDWETFQEKAA